MLVGSNDCFLPAIVELPVKFTKTLEEETSALKGQPLYLTCELNKEREVTWKKDGQVLKPKTGKIQINVIGLQHAVTIQNSNEDDAGVYTCGVENLETKTDVKIIGKNVTVIAN